MAGNVLVGAGGVILLKLREVPVTDLRTVEWQFVRTYFQVTSRITPLPWRVKSFGFQRILWRCGSVVTHQLSSALLI